MNYKIERRTINDVDLVLAYQFDDFSADKPFGADTWISVQNWCSIYAHVESIVDRHSDQNESVDEQSFELSDTPFTCYVSMSSMTSSFGQSIAAFIAHAPSQTPYERTTFISIRVSKSISSKFTNHIKTLEKEIVELKRQLKRSSYSSSSKKTTSSSSATRSSSRNHGTSKYKPGSSQSKEGSSQSKKPESTISNEILAEAHEEYVPNAPTPLTPTLRDIKYQPGKVPDTVDHKHIEQYVPPEVSPISAPTPKYIPSSSTSSKPLTNGNKAKSSMHPTQKSDIRVESRRNKRTATELRRDHSPDIFATDDDSQPTAATPAARVSSRPQRHVAEKQSHSTKTEAAHVKSKSPVASKRPKSSRSGAKSSASTTPAKSPAVEAKSKMLTDEEFKVFMETKDKAIVVMDNLKKMLTPEELPDIEIFSLKDYAANDIEQQFEEHRPTLQRLFDNYCRQKDYNVTRPKDLSEFCCNYLLEESQQMKMMEVMTSSFGGAEKLSVYYDLFWKVMMPEWTLSMFMARYDFTRAEATERMRVQEKITAAQYPLEDTMSFGDDSFEKVKKRR